MSRDADLIPHPELTREMTHEHHCGTCTTVFACDGDIDLNGDGVAVCNLDKAREFDCPACYLRFLEAEVRAVLERAVLAHAGRTRPVSTSEATHAADWAAMAITMMSQPLARKASEQITSLWDHFVTGVAEDAKQFDEDHSAYLVVSQAIDRMAWYLRKSNPMTAFMHVLRRAAGRKAW